MSKKALGRGLGALFSESEEKPEGKTDKEVNGIPASEVRLMPIEKIAANPRQPRSTFAEEALKELSDSIQQKGILQPLIVNADGDTYTIIAGERRFRAAKMAGLTEVPVLIKHLSGIDQFEIALIENIQREDLSPLEEAQAYATLIKESGLTQDEVAKLVGKNRSTVANSLRLLKMPMDMRAALDSGEITAGHARAILSLPNPADRQILFKRVMDAGLSVRKAEELSQRLSEGKRAVEEKRAFPGAEGKGPAAGETKKAPEIVDYEKKLLTKYGTKAEIQGTLSGGRIVLHYYSAEDLERIMNVLE